MDSEARRPVILFDGVCNLCTSSAKWVIANDPDGVFDLASLQSQAAAKLLQGKEVADSIILVDEDGGVYQRSDAIIRIARKLGRPWAVAKLGPLVPKPMRDWMYRMIAARRYKWFGKQDSCMVPTPAIRARFLDRDEPAPEVPPTPEPTGPQARPFYALLTGLGFFYLLVFIFPFPISQMSFGLDEWLEKLRSPAIIWFGKTFFGLHLTILPNGSGDTTYNYVEVVFNLSVALLLTLIVVAAMRARPISPRMWSWMRIYTRYYLATVMLAYGFSKVFLSQFPDPGPSRLLTTFGTTTPMGLLWTFMGASHAYQFFGGLAECVGGVLLFWRRTTLLGSLCCIAVLANVVMLNFCYDVPVKIFSSHLFLLSVFLAWPWLPRLVNLLLLHLPAPGFNIDPFPVESPAVRLTGRILKPLLILFLIGSQLYGALVSIPKEIAQMQPNPPSLSGIYSAKPASTAGNDARDWAKVGIEPYGYAKVILTTGETKNVMLKFDSTKGTVSMVDMKKQTPTPLQFTQSGNTIHLFGKSLDVTLAKSPPAENTLTTRGFHWINEYPCSK